MIIQRKEKSLWHDLLIQQRDPDSWTYENVKMAGPESIPAIPAVYKIKIVKSSTASTADDTFIAAGVTMTAKSSASGNAQYGLSATASDIATKLAANTITNFTATASSDTVTLTQTTAGTGSAPEIGEGTDTTVSATVTTEQAYVPAITSGDNLKYDLVPGDPVYLVSTDSDGVKTVAPVNNSTSANISAFCGFVRHPGTVKGGDTEELVIATGPCRLDKDLLPKKDLFNHTFNWSISNGTIGKAASDKGFRFGKEIVQ